MIHTFRKICCIAGALTCLCAAHASAEVAVRSDLARASLSQRGRSLIVSVWTRSPVSLAALERQPRAGDAAPFLCLRLARAGRRGERQLCVGGPDPRRRLGLALLNARGRATARRTVSATVRQPRPKHLVATLFPGRAGLAPGRYRWQLSERRRRCGVRVRDCLSSLPTGRPPYAFRLRPVRPVGCTGGTPGLIRHGSRDRPVVALTFDDGPSEYTPGFLDVLREKGAHATFFEVGQEIGGREDTMRRILREGDEIGNHTMHHEEYPGLGAIAPVSDLIEGATHFRPCLFRPPGGAVNSSVVAAAGSLGMQTITWDVDPSDWTTPGSAAVYSRVVGAARPGSIILMHDGGGPRGGTLAALPAIIDTLRGRGYRFATVSALLGHRLLYRPYG